MGLNPGWVRKIFFTCFRFRITRLFVLFKFLNSSDIFCLQLLLLIFDTRPISYCIKKMFIPVVNGSHKSACAQKIESKDYLQP